MLIRYRDDIKFNDEQQDIIERCNGLIAEYEANDISLTLRSLYYRFISLWPEILDKKNEGRNLLKHYKKLGALMGDARLAGLVSWNALEDMTRSLEDHPHWDSPAAILESAHYSYREDVWADQDVAVEMWVEKDALINTIKGVCEANDVPYFSCRGNCSLSEMWAAGQRIQKRLEETGRETIILYGGDFDPKGWDMTRDIRERLSMFAETDVEVRRLFLNPDQVERFRPVPLPTKDGDTTTAKFRKEFGNSCYEADSLDPLEIRRVIEAEFEEIRDQDMWDASVTRQQSRKNKLREMIDSFD